LLLAPRTHRSISRLFTKNKEQAAQQAEQQQQQATQQQQAASQEQLDLFKKGFAACLEPRGYTVK
jgi:hypothetical protein